MERRTVVRALRAIRRRKRGSQRQLAQGLGISKSEMSRWETTALEACSVLELERWTMALNAHLVLELRIDGERPLTDASHAEIQNGLVALLRTSGWAVEAEPSFNHYGDRGRIDVLAFHPVLRILLVVEIKTRLDDMQDLFGRLDVKRRIAPKIAAERGWQASAIVPAIVVRDGRTARRRVAAHQALFATFPVRARAAMAWLRQPRAPIPSGLLVLLTPPGDRG